MITSNRSADFPPLTPNLMYRDISAAVRWLQQVLGFAPHLVFAQSDGVATHAQMRHGTSVLMLSQWTHAPSHDRPAHATVVLVDDVDAALARAVAAGATIVAPAEDKVFGERQCAVADPEGHHWWLTQHIADVAPADWGATLS